MGAVLYSLFISRASYVIQPDRSGAFAEKSFPNSHNSVRKAKLTTDHFGCVPIPLIIADCTVHTASQNLDTAICAVCATNESHCVFNKQQILYLHTHAYTCGINALLLVEGGMEEDSVDGTAGRYFRWEQGNVRLTANNSCIFTVTAVVDSPAWRSAVL